MDEQLLHNIRVHLNAAIASLKTAEHYANSETVPLDIQRRIGIIIGNVMHEVRECNPVTVPEGPQG